MCCVIDSTHCFFTALPLLSNLFLLFFSSFIMAQQKEREIEYSDKYTDDQFEYRHVILPKEYAKLLPKPMRILTETEWRQIGVQQSRGWVHYEVHRPEPHVLLFRRPIG